MKEFENRAKEFCCTLADSVIVKQEFNGLCEKCKKRFLRLKKAHNEAETPGGETFYF